jgi:AraC-like DNA-binding protein
MMTKEPTHPSIAVQGSFGRVAIHATSRPLVEHAHQEFNFIFHIGGSETGFRVGKTDYVLDENSAILINPWMPHAKLSSASGDTLVLTVLPDPQWLAATLQFGDLPLVKLFSRPHVALTPKVRQHLQGLEASLNGGAAFGDAMNEPAVRQLVLALGDAYVDQALRNTFHRRDHPMDPRIGRSLALIRDAAMENPNLDDVASQVGLSRSRFFEQFKTCVGASPQQYLDWARMAAATKLLATTDYSLADISLDLGFSAPSHFARFFAQHMGVPPSVFRRGVITDTAMARAPA